jgi:hypothetical protein
MIDLAKVVKVHWETHSVDLVMSVDGSTVSGVRVMSPMASSDSGLSDLAMPVTGNPQRLKAAKDNERDVLAVVSYFNGLPVVLGFLHPRASQILFKDQERMIDRHASDVYKTIDKNGNMELRHPSGLYIRIATDTAHEDLTGKDFNKKWKITKNTDKQVHLHIEQAGGVASIDIAPNGAIVVNTVSTLTATATGAATVTSSASVTVNAATCTINAPSITLNGNTVVNGSLSQGMGGAGGACTMLGPVTVSGDVVAGGKSLDTHTHPDAQGGNTGAPN